MASSEALAAQAVSLMLNAVTRTDRSSGAAKSVAGYSLREVYRTKVVAAGGADAHPHGPG